MLPGGRRGRHRSGLSGARLSLAEEQLPRRRAQAMSPPLVPSRLHPPLPPAGRRDSAARAVQRPHSSAVRMDGCGNGPGPLPGRPPSYPLPHLLPLIPLSHSAGGDLPGTRPLPLRHAAVEAPPAPARASAAAPPLLLQPPRHHPLRHPWPRDSQPRRCRRTRRLLPPVPRALQLVLPHPLLRPHPHRRHLRRPRPLGFLRSVPGGPHQLPRRPLLPRPAALRVPSPTPPTTARMPSPASCTTTCSRRATTHFTSPLPPTPC